MSLMQKVTGLSPAGKTAAGGAGAGVVLTAVGFVSGLWQYVLYIGVTLVVAALLVLAFRFFLKWRQKGRATPFVGKLLGTTSGSPTTADAGQRARIDDLRKRFEEGIEKFRSAGKDVYSLPWVLMAGPSGSGKTEAVRHCSVGFPPGLQDPLQGTGGTLNMNWWFTNHAVVLDTAGKLFMEEGGGEWKELMKLLKSWRPLQPINGMILAIGVDSLIKDSAEKIEHEAAKVARQLDAITRDLDVRFPVYIIVTKCDLLTGFREFFTTITDPQLQHQMLGWSNPADLDETFQSDRVTEHLAQVCGRLVRRRGALLSDPTPQNMQAVNPRRMDEVDALYALPESLSGIGSRLRRYLELIFVQGEWSAKPLFLRGIYFTSALQEGRELDEAIARAMGVPVDALPGGGAFRNEKSYFLRDLLMQKVFPEKGLVTRATNVKQQQRGRKLALLGSGIGVVVLCLAFTVLGYYSLGRRVREPADFWTRVHGELKAPTNGYPLLSDAGGGRVAVNAAAATPGAEFASPVDLLERSAEQTEKPVDVPRIFRALAGLMQGQTTAASINGSIATAHAALTRQSLVVPLVTAAQKRFASKDAVAWVDAAGADTGAFKVLASLVQMERSAPGKGSFDPNTSFPVEDYLRLTAGRDIEKLGGPTELGYLTHAVHRAFEVPSAEWPPADMKGRSDVPALKAAADAFNLHWPERLRSDPRIGAMVSLQPAIKEFGEADRALVGLVGRFDPNLPKDAAAFKEFKQAWDTEYARLRTSWELISKDVEKIKPEEIDRSIEAAQASLRQVIDEKYRAVLGLGGVGAAIKSGAEAASSAGAKADDTSKATDQLGALAERAEKLQFESMRDKAPEALRPVLQDLWNRWHSLWNPDGVAALQFAALKDTYGPEMRKLFGAAAVAGDATVTRVIAARYGAYKQADDMLAAPARAVAWGAPRTDTLMSVRDAIDEINADLAARTIAIDQRAKAAGETAGDGTGPVQKTGRLAARIAAMGRRTAVIDGILKRSADSGDKMWVKDRVKELAGQLAGGKSAAYQVEVPAPFDPPTIQFGAEFDAAAAKRIFDDGITVASLAGVSAGKPGEARAAEARPGEAPADGIIDPQGHALDANNALEALRGYARLYFGDWAGRPVQVFKDVKASSWREYRDLVKAEVQGKASDIASKLDAFSAAMLKAMSAIPPEFGEALKPVAAQAGGTLQEWQKALGAAEGAGGGAAREGSLRNKWMKFTLPQEAYSAIAGLDSGELLGDYFPEFTGTGVAGRPPTPANRYWDCVRLKCLELLTDDMDKELREVFGDMERHHKLPLSTEPPAPWAADRSAAAGITPADLGRIRANLPALQNALAARNAPRQKNIGGGERTTVPEINALLDRLFSANKSLQDRRLPDLMESWRVWIPLIAPEEPLKATLFVLDDKLSGASAQTAEGQGWKSAAAQSRTFEVRSGERSVIRNDIDKDMKFLENVPLTDGTVLKITFFDRPEDQGGKRSGVRELASGWTVLELLCDPDARPVPGDALGKKWMAPVRFNGTVNGQPGKYYIWMGVELSGALPARDKWPDQGVWGSK